MSIIGRRSIIPGVFNNQRLVDWIDDNNITYHPNLTIEQSKLGGIGLFFKVDLPSATDATLDDDEGDLTILTIPEQSTFDYMNLLKILNEIKARDKSFPDIEIKEGELITNILEIIEPHTETEILISYFVSMKMLKELQNVNSVYYKQSPLRKFDLYLDVLLNTKVLSFPTIDKSDQKSDPKSEADPEAEPEPEPEPESLKLLIDSDPFLANHIQSCQYLKFDYDSYIEELNVLYDHDINFGEFIIPFETYYQIVQAVRSRSLEIPHEHNEKEEQEQEDEDVEDEGVQEKAKPLDFYTELNGNITVEDLINDLNINDFDNERKINDGSRNGNEGDKNGNDKEVEDADAEDENQDDYYTNVTLVPVLDFANHIHNNNSYFDIDRSNKDIVLKLKREELKKWQKSSDEVNQFEITINYSPIESIQHFIMTYGFIPESKEEAQLAEGKKDPYFQLFEFQLINSNKYYPHITEICKWLRILPQVQLILNLNSKQVYFNFNGNKLPIIFLSGITYNPDWREDAIEQFKVFNDIPIDYDIDNDKILTILNQQEKEFDIINGIEPIGIKYHDEVIHDVNDILDKVSDEHSKAYEELLLKTIEFIIYHINDKLQLLKENIGSLVSTIDIKDQYNEMMINYFQLQIKMFTLIIDKFKSDPASLILPAYLANSDWETNYRSLPRELILD